MLAYCEVGLCPKLYSFNLLVSLQLVKLYALLLDLKLTSRFTPVPPPSQKGVRRGDLFFYLLLTSALTLEDSRHLVFFLHHSIGFYLAAFTFLPCVTS